MRNSKLHPVSNLKISDLDVLCTWMRQVGALRVRTGEFELVLGDPPAVQPQATQPVPEAKTADQLRRELEELLFASSGG